MKAHDELSKAIKELEAEIISLKAGNPLKLSKNAEMLDDLLPQNIKGDTIDKSAKMFTKSLAVGWS